MTGEFGKKDYENFLASKAYEIDDHQRLRIDDDLQSLKRNAWEFVSARENRLSSTSIALNSGAAVASLAFMASDGPKELVGLPLIAFLIGLVAAMIEQRLSVHFFSRCFRSASNSAEQYWEGKLTVHEALSIKPGRFAMFLGDTAGYASWIGQLAFVAGILLGVFNFWHMVGA